MKEEEKIKKLKEKMKKLKESGKLSEILRISHENAADAIKENREKSSFSYDKLNNIIFDH